MIIIIIIIIIILVNYYLDDIMSPPRDVEPAGTGRTSRAELARDHDTLPRETNKTKAEN